MYMCTRAYVCMFVWKDAHLSAGCTGICGGVHVSYLSCINIYQEQQQQQQQREQREQYNIASAVQDMH